VAWLLTAAPFFIDALLLLAALAGLLSPVQLRTPWHAALDLFAVPLVAGALILIGWTAGVHRARVSLWHQPDDAPAELVTYGPYALVRHPFYAAFILLLLGAAAALPHTGTLVMLLAGVVQLGRTARREERRLLASDFGAECRAYMQRTGRFLPGFAR
jgi:protein-S-isoprenylcysteine O-methyltransferase Ste14